MKTRVFVYGTLRQGEVNAYLLEGARFLGEHKTLPKYQMYDLGAYPGLVSGGSTAIIGEVYEVDRNQFARLDQLEAYPQLYDRQLIPTQWGMAWVYLYRASLAGRKYVVEGDWVSYRQSRKLLSRSRDFCSVR